MATITKTPSNTWKAIIGKRGWPTTVKTFRTKRVAQQSAANRKAKLTFDALLSRTFQDTK